MDSTAREGDGSWVWGVNLLFLQWAVGGGCWFESCFFEEVVVPSTCSTDIISKVTATSYGGGGRKR